MTYPRHLPTRPGTVPATGRPRPSPGSEMQREGRVPTAGPAGAGGLVRTQACSSSCPLTGPGRLGARPRPDPPDLPARWRGSGWLSTVCREHSTRTPRTHGPPRHQEHQRGRPEKSAAGRHRRKAPAGPPLLPRGCPRLQAPGSPVRQARLKPAACSIHTPHVVHTRRALWGRADRPRAPVGPRGDYGLQAVLPRAQSPPGRPPPHRHPPPCGLSSRGPFREEHRGTSLMLLVGLETQFVPCRLFQSLAG